VLAALTFVAALVIQACLMGLGDALVVRVGQGKATIERALASSLSAVLLSSFVGMLVVLLYSLAQVPLDQPYVWAAVLAACGTVGVACFGQVLFYGVYARQQLVTASGLMIVTSTVTTVAVVVFCWVLDLEVFGGVLAGLVAAVVLLAAAAAVLYRAGVKVRLSWDSVYLRPALQYGVRAQLANLLAYSSARVDLLLVYGLTTYAEAGLYSVALTLGTLTGFVALALSYASFPGMARMSEAAALQQTATLARMGALLATPFAAILAVLAWLAIPLLLGTAYEGSLIPAVILLFANVLWGQQWLLSRALAARGDPTVLFRSFAINLVAMLAVDLALIPLFGPTGAALGSVVGPAAGLVICCRAYARRGVRVQSFLPRRSDIAAMRDLVLKRFRRARSG